MSLVVSNLNVADVKGKSREATVYLLIRVLVPCRGIIKGLNNVLADVMRYMDFLALISIPEVGTGNGSALLMHL